MNNQQSIIKAVFFSSSEHALPVLETLIQDKDIEVSAVVTRPDRVRGKNQPPSPTPTKLFALEKNIPVLTPETLKDNQTFYKAIEDLNPDLVVVADYALLLPAKLLKIPKWGGINIHPSLLPKYPGSSPAQWAIARGEKISGLSVIKMSEEFDEGPIIEQWEIPIDNRETSESLYCKSFSLAAEKLPALVKDHDNWSNLIGTNRPDATDIAFYARRLRKDDGKINWSDPPEVTERKVRAFSPWPGTWTTLAEIIDYIIRHPIRSASEVDGSQTNQMLSRVRHDNKDKRRIKIIKAHIDEGKLVIDRLQVEGKKPISWKEFERGYLK